MQDEPDGMLFTVSEKASVEAGKAAGHDTEWGDGWLFNIARTTEEAVNDMRCYDMSGIEPFAKDAEGNYYVYYHPTDVRFVRESNEAMTADQEQWTMLNEWAATVKDAFIEANEGLTAVSYSNTGLDICLARLAYMDNVPYTISANGEAALEPGNADAAPFVEKLVNGVTFNAVDNLETPEGDSFILNFPDEDQYFEFYVSAGAENCIRHVIGSNYEQLYMATFEDGTTKAGQVISDWYDALAAANGAAQ